MTEFEIKNLQRERRFSDVGLRNLYLVIYLPLGLLIFLLRLGVGLLIWILGTILPDVSFTRNLLTKLFCLLFGITVRVQKSYNKKSVKVIISNQISPLDHLAVHTATDCLLPTTTTLYSPLSYAVGIHNTNSLFNIDEVKKNIGIFILNNNDASLLFQPENKITNGTTLLKFKDWPFSFTNEVQPVWLKVHRPVLDISVTTLEAHFWSDIFWYMFSPVTIYDLCFLPVADKGEMNETEFSEQVRQKIAEGMNIELCNHTANDLVEWEKRYILEQRRARMVHGPASSANAQNNPELHRMARQVKEVLPMVPYNVIFRDLTRTKNVDITITNILEGHVAYTPETVPTPSVSPTPNVHVPSVTPSTSREVTGKDFNTAAPTFPKSAQERMQAFQERKIQLIMNARKKYIDKHGLSALASNDC